MRDFVEIWQFLKDCDCNFTSLRENFDTSTAAGEMVMFGLANFAQFESRQTQERVILSHKSRAKRGLYNGGTVPLGYKTIPNKAGYLEIDGEKAETVKKAFDAFLKFETLQATAKFLNSNGVKINRHVQGGGRWARLDFWTVENLQSILRNKSYKGVRVFNNGKDEVKAVWKPIIDPIKFDRVGEILEKNYGRKKPFTAKRYPYQLSGITFCAECGDVMCGKSAHGKNKKYGYYEHSWATKRGSTHVKELFKCDPHRVPARIAEEAVTKEILKLFKHPKYAQDIILEAHKIHERKVTNNEIKNLKLKISGYESNLNALVERLAELPSNVSAALLYKQMGKIESAKEDASNLLVELKSQQSIPDELPASFDDYKAFIGLADKAFKESSNPELRSQIIKRLVHKVEMGIDRINIHFYAGCDRITKDQGAGGPQGLLFFGNKCSKTLTNGAEGGT